MKTKYYKCTEEISWGRKITAIYKLVNNTLYRYSFPYSKWDMAGLNLKPKDLKAYKIYPIKDEEVFLEFLN